MGLTVANVKVTQFRALKRAADLERIATASGDRAPCRGKTRNDLKTTLS